MTDVTQKPIFNERVPESSENRSRFNGFSLLLTEIGIMFTYGFAGLYRQDTVPVTANSSPFAIIPFILLFLFLIAGFGMLMNVYRFGNWLGLGSVLIMIAVNFQLHPLLQKLFLDIILTGFGTRNVDVGNTSITNFWMMLTNTKIDVSIMLMRITLLSIVSGMVVMTAVIGRIGAMQIIKFAFVYSFFWVINFYTLVYMNIVYQDFNDAANYAPYFFDMFGTTYVYLFAVCFGLPYSCLMKRQLLPSTHPRNDYTRQSLALSQIGTGFITAFFVFSSCLVVDYETFGNPAGNSNGRFSIFFGIIGSIIGTFSCSVLIGNGKVGYKDALISTITGAVVMGGIAPVLNNIGIIIMIGVMTGFFTALYMQTLHKKLNKFNVNDNLGLFGPFCIASFLGSFVVAPATVQAYSAVGSTFTFTNVVVPASLAGYQLVYVGITAGIGLVAGLIMAAVTVCDRDAYGLGSNSRIFLNDFGLYSPPENQNNYMTNGEGHQSQNMLNHQGTNI